MAQPRRTLVVFDFDNTLVDDNVDTWILSVRPDLQLHDGNMREFRKTFPCWTDFMDHIFDLIQKESISKTEILKHMGQLRLYEQAMKAVHAVGNADCAEAIVLSDANTVFIEHILNECGVRHLFKHVFTNPAHFDETDRLRIRHYHSHSCPTCTNSPNLCKGQVLRGYLEQEPRYDKVVMVGDGRGDYCPSLQLTEQDAVVCRKGYTLEKLITDKTTQSCKAEVHVVDFVQSLGDTIVSKCL